ncbi:hypothetical protein [Nevskia ramosa]|uniref:hypothetical protein n=1 Tax=Nevskia ramosa TaxID=64002 RepID=UPI003D0AF601
MKGQSKVQAKAILRDYATELREIRAKGRRRRLIRMAVGIAEVVAGVIVSVGVVVAYVSFKVLH